MRVLACLALVAVLLLAGCSGKAPSKDGGAVGPQPKDLDIDEDASTGAISGVVVDEAIRPVPGAIVALTGLGNVSTDDGGLFTFTDLAPGTYFLSAAAVGFLPVQSAVEVVAGEVARSKMLMVRQPDTGAYHFTLHHQGFIEASPAAGGSLFNILIDEFADNPLCSCSLNFNTTGHDVKTLVVEAVWQDTLPSPTGASSLYLEVFPGELDDGTADIQGGFLPSPILEHYPIEAWGEGESNVDWRVRLTGDAESVQYNQPYDLYVTVFAVEAAPEGWSLVGGDL